MHKGLDSSTLKIAVGLVLFTGLAIGSYHLIGAQRASAQTQKKAASPPSGFDAVVRDNSERMMKEGEQTFRFDTFGSEAFWGDALQLHKAIAGEKNGGVGGGVSPKTALSVGLKIDSDALPDSLKQQLKDGKVDLNDPAITLALLKLNSVVGVTGIFDNKGSLQSMGLQCAFCHSTVDDSLAGHWEAPGRLGQQGLERRCYRFARSESQAIYGSPRSRCRHPEKGIRRVGPWLFRRRTGQGW